MAGIRASAKVRCGGRVAGIRVGPGWSGPILALGYSPFRFFLAVSGGFSGGTLPERARRMPKGEQATGVCGVDP
ncbi:conserved hypothetical protein [Frankia sp. Hr75.2]|nr:conserved hypothetical protein [Frankia sp. Hr75.2]SQD93669.1 conserved hypothetical protein [Parafrankia sp. Ea1.12]